MTPEEHRDQHPEYQENDSQLERCMKCEYYSTDYADCCKLESCNYERKAPTLTEALKIAECLEIDYGTMDDEEVEELDLAVDVIFGFCKKYLKDKAEWLPWVDGYLGVKTPAGICPNCRQYNSYQTPFCPHCGKLMKGEFVRNEL